jgi:hypothetical protein
MANTTYFGWETPDDTDLVKDGAAAIRTLGQAIDTSLQDLEGGTSGQILSKNSNTDMDFVWITNDVGDITEVVASTPLTGGGSSGSITVGIQDGTTAQKGAVQLEDSTSSTSTTKASTPNSVKSAYDLANAAIPKSLVDAAGDLIYATADNTPARLAIGTAGKVLTVNSGATAPEWTTPAAGGGMTLINTGGTALTGTTTTISSIPGTYKELVIFIDGHYASVDYDLYIRPNGDTTGSNYQQFVNRGTGSTNNAFVDNSATGVSCLGYAAKNASNQNFTYAVIPNYASTTAKKVINAISGFIQTTNAKAVCNNNCYYASATAITSIDIFDSSASGTWSGGTVYVYGVN